MQIKVKSNIKRGKDQIWSHFFRENKPLRGKERRREEEEEEERGAKKGMELYGF